MAISFPAALKVGKYLKFLRPVGAAAGGVATGGLGLAVTTAAWVVLPMLWEKLTASISGEESLKNIEREARDLRDVMARATVRIYQSEQATRGRQAREFEREARPIMSTLQFASPDYLPNEAFTAEESAIVGPGAEGFSPTPRVTSPVQLLGEFTKMHPAMVNRRA